MKAATKKRTIRYTASDGTVHQVPLDAAVVATFADGGTLSMRAVDWVQAMRKQRRVASGIKHGRAGGAPARRPPLAHIRLQWGELWIKAGCTIPGKKTARSKLIVKLTRQYGVTPRAARGWITEALKPPHTWRKEKRK